MNGNHDIIDTLKESIKTNTEVISSLKALREDVSVLGIDYKSTNAYLENLIKSLPEVE